MGPHPRGGEKGGVETDQASTPTGRSLLGPALALAGWAIEHVPHIEASRAAYEEVVRK